MKRDLPRHRLSAKNRVLFYLLCSLLLLPMPGRAELVGYWNFDEGLGTTAKDISSHQNHGNLLAIGIGAVPTWVSGRTGDESDYALDFSQGQVLVPDNTSLHLTNRFTVAAWMFDRGSNYGHLFVAGDGGAGQRNWLLQTSAFGGDAAYFWSATHGAFQQRLDFIPALLTWHHLAVTYDGSSLRAYLDGVLQTTKPTGGASLSAWGSLRLGGFSVYGSGFEGFLDDMILFNTVEDISSIMDRSHPEMNPPPPPATFTITPIRPAGVQASTSTGFLYTLQYLDALNTLPLNWLNVASQVEIPGTGILQNFSDPTAQPFRVYRLARDPEP